MNDVITPGFWWRFYRFFEAFWTRFDIIDKFSILLFSFLKLVHHGLSIMLIIRSQYRSNTLLSIFNIVTFLVIEQVWEIVLLCGINSFGSLKISFTRLKVLIKDHTRSNIIEVYFINDFTWLSCCKYLYTTQCRETWNDVWKWGDVYNCVSQGKS
jgi:hypothetical protein